MLVLGMYIMMVLLLGLYQAYDSSQYYSIHVSDCCGRYSGMITQEDNLAGNKEVTYAATIKRKKTQWKEENSCSVMIERF